MFLKHLRGMTVIPGNFSKELVVYQPWSISKRTNSSKTPEDFTRLKDY
jgi:hypothetical protein